MPSRQTVEAFVALVEAGDYVGAIEHFYAPDASTRENTGEPVVGREVLMAKERGVMARFRKIEAVRIGPVLIEGDLPVPIPFVDKLNVSVQLKSYRGTTPTFVPVK